MVEDRQLENWQFIVLYISFCLLILAVGVFIGFEYGRSVYLEEGGTHLYYIMPPTTEPSTIRVEIPLLPTPTPFPSGGVDG